MSKIYYDTDVEYAVITLKTRSAGGSNLTIYAATEYYEAGALYSGSPEMFPLLQSSPTVMRSVGDHFGIRHSIDLQIEARMPFSIFNKGMIDLRETYEFYRASAKIYYGTKPYDAQAPSSSFIIKQDCEVLTSDWGNETLTLSCRDIWYEDKEVSFRIPSTSVITDFVGGLKERYVGEYAPIPFGADQVVDCLVYDVNSTNAYFFVVGFNIDSDHTVKDFKEWYAENITPDLSPLRYLRVDEATSVMYGTIYSAFGLGSSTPFHLGQFWRSTPFTPAKNSVLAAFMCHLAPQGTQADINGELTFSVHRAEEFSSSGTYPPTGNALASLTYDPQDLIFGFPGVQLYLPDLVPLVAGKNYCIVCRFSNRDDTTNYVSMNVLGFSSPDHDALDRSTEDGGWVFQSGVRSSVVPQALVPTTETTQSQAGFYWNRITVAYTATVGSGALNADTAIGFKYKVDGIKDNAAGTYTGTGNALIENPADLTRFILVRLMGVDPADIDTSSFTSVRSSQATESIEMGFVIDRETYGEDLIIEICKQSRMVLYKETGGKYKVYFWEPSPAAGSVDNAFKFFELQDELTVVSIQDEPIIKVFNDFDQDYGNNALEFPANPESIRRSRTDKFLNRQFLNKDDSTAGDTAREAKCSQSHSLYGVRRMDFPYDLHTNATGVANMQNYFCDRFHLKNQVVTVEIPRRQYYNSVELLESALVDSDEIGDALGYMSLEGARDAGQDTLSAAVSNYPTAAFNYGRLKGIITGVEESGSFMRVTILTDDGPGSY